MRLENKVALVTGAGSGIGRATSVLFAAEGAKVVASDLVKDSAEATVEIIHAAGGDALDVEADVTVGADAERMVRTAVDSFGSLNVLVNSAGVATRNVMGPDTTPEQAWDRVIEINLKGTFLVTWNAVREMEKAGVGSIINMASIMALVGYSPGMGNEMGGFDPYHPSKGGIVQLTKNLALDYASRNIRVNCVCPGYTRTEITRALWEDPERLKLLEELHPMGRMGDPEDIAYAALYLASDESSFVTGIPLVVDGGYTAR